MSLVNYCCVPARQGLRRNAMAPRRDKTRASDPLVRQKCDWPAKWCIGKLRREMGKCKKMALECDN